ncbi:MAG: PLP-dependent aminotransferase family protein, partial [Dactylosporangium sp.]|nr:PLP-dependent aminotransferase family protein [Dactylosporangium sp.]NNJ61147.1 PLP-dependent aminotransferase family protein [Dactylosporangium sp.]
MTAEQLISFARGAPSLDIVDVAGLKAAAARAFDSDPAGITAYGTSVGYPPLRAWIANKHGVDIDQVLVTNGSLQADAFLFEHLVRPGDAVLVERPTYDRTLLNLRGAGAKVHQVALDEHGLDIEELRTLLASGVRPTMAHIIPNFQNPAGVTLSAERRTALLELAAEYDFVIFEDDPYADIRFRGERLPSMLSMDTAGRVVHASSFTKTVCPGVRVGYLVGPKPIISQIAKKATNLYISPGMVSEAIVYQFCVSGDIDRSIETVCRALGERATALGAALRTHIPGARFTEPDGGYFLWVELPDGTSAAAVA